MRAGSKSPLALAEGCGFHKFEVGLPELALMKQNQPPVLYFQSPSKFAEGLHFYQVSLQQVVHAELGTYVKIIGLFLGT